MKRRVVDGVLLLVILVGSIMAWRTDRERARLQAEFQRLARITGNFTVDDPSKIYIQALETGEPLHFAWRIHLPPATTRTLQNHGLGGVGETWVNDAGDFIARVRFLEGKEGRLGIYEHLGSTSMQRDYGNQELAALLHGRWDKIRVELPDSHNVRVIERNATVLLVRLTLPADIEAESRAKLASASQYSSLPVLLELRLAPESP